MAAGHWRGDAWNWNHTLLVGRTRASVRAPLHPRARLFWSTPAIVAGRLAVMASLCTHMCWTLREQAIAQGHSASMAKTLLWPFPPSAAAPHRLCRGGPSGWFRSERELGCSTMWAAKRKKKEVKEPEMEAAAVEDGGDEAEDDFPMDGEGQDDLAGGDEDLSEGGVFDGGDFEPKPRSRRKGYTRIQDEEILPPGTRYQGGRYGLQFFVGDLVECMRDGELQYARVARIPTDERPMDGSFIVKWDSDGEEWKCAYKDLKKPRRPESVDWPDWIEDWWPAEPPPSLEEELKKEWTWVSDMRPGASGGGMVPESPDQGVYSQNKDDPYRPKPGQVLYGVTC
uniref:Uncharacterized protein n=1 Tax=Alexandrium monilatum TaxID=311494 RepID=A0A7S4SW86_9DINO